MGYKKFINDLPKDKIITILPHDTTDVDASISAILLSKLFDFYNIPNEIVIFDTKIDKWTEYFLKKFGYDLSKYFVKEEDNTRKLFLVDHYKTLHKGAVIGCIDHHYTLEDIKYNYYMYQHSCSTAYLIFKIMQNLDFPITKEIIALVSYASLVDTCSFKSTKTIQKEKKEIISLLKENNFNTEEMINEGLCLDNLAQMSLKEIAFNGIKTYNYGKNIVKSSYIQTDSFEISRDVIEYILALVKNEDIDMWVFIVSDLIHEKAKVYKITKDKIITKQFNRIMSRGKDIMPEVEKEFFNC